MIKVRNIVLDELKGKIVPVDTVNLSCPFGGINPISCQNCRFSVIMIPEDKLEQLRKAGDYDAVNRAYTCLFVVIAHNLIKKRKKK